MTDVPQPLRATPKEIEAGARALAQLDGADYFKTRNVDGMGDYRESARAVLEGALPLIAERLRRP